MSKYSLIQGDCLEVMKHIPPASIDLILCDLPYGCTKNKWDIIIPFEPLWEHYERIIKPNGAIILFAQGMFTAKLMMSSKYWRYNLVWDKVLTSGFLNARRQPLRSHEDICVFYKKQPTYNPQMVKCEPHKRNHSRGDMKKQFTNNNYGNFVATPTVISDEKFPKSIITVSKEHSVGKFYHPTQKPVELLEYLVKTYTNENDLVLDNCMGSGSTCIACLNTNRRFLGIELDEIYFNIARGRIENEDRHSCI